MVPNIPEPCRQCPSLDVCIGAIEHNINSLLLPTKKEVVECGDFKNLSDILIERVAQHFAQAINKHNKGE